MTTPPQLSGVYNTGGGGASATPRMMARPLMEDPASREARRFKKLRDSMSGMNPRVAPPLGGSQTGQPSDYPIEANDTFTWPSGGINDLSGPYGGAMNPGQLPPGSSGLGRPPSLYDPLAPEQFQGNFAEQMLRESARVRRAGQ